MLPEAERVTEKMTRQDMPTRLLRLLSLLQSRAEWPGGELAAKLGVTTRTLRRDVERLRNLDYVVEATTGVFGGYRLGSGQKLPPLHLDDDEAIAVAAGLVTGAGGSLAEDASMRALAKLKRLLPTRLRPRLAAMTNATAAVSPRAAARAEPAVIARLALCCSERELVTFSYRKRSGATSTRRVEPSNLLTLEGLWYLLGFDVERQDWRVFRIDRMEQPTSTGHRFVPRGLPAGDPAAYLAQSLMNAPYRYRAQITVPLPAESVRARLFAPIPGVITDAGPDRCTVRLSTENAEVITQYIVAIGALTEEFELDACEEIRARLRALGSRFSLV
ncbi:helix-turn-helix transcriptional regulator [Saccharopolyspora taberi]|uniref:YafY family protein n=1 Tax=Saccharopolyspora taberi TaxID=60895 RepID=A0ABN3V797_9PSEU